MSSNVRPRTISTEKVSSIARWSEAEDDDDDDSFLSLGEGPLHLHVTAQQQQQQQHQRTRSPSSGRGSGTGEGDLASERAGLSSSNVEVTQSATVVIPEVNEGRQWDIAGGDGDDGSEDDEKSNTIKATQLPSSFTEALAQAKAAKAQQSEAASAFYGGGHVRHLGSRTQAAPASDWDEDLEGFDSPGKLQRLKQKASFTSHISDSEDEGSAAHGDLSFRSSSMKGKAVRARTSPFPSSSSSVAKNAARDSDNEDIESDFDLPDALQSVSLASSGRQTKISNASASELELLTPFVSAAASRSNITSDSLKLPAARQGPRSATSSFSASSSPRNARSPTSMSYTSGGSETTIDDEDFFNDIVLPPFFTPPSSVDSSTSRKVNLQQLLGEKLKARAGLAKSLQDASTALSDITKPSSSNTAPHAASTSSVTESKAKARSGNMGSVGRRAAEKYREKAGEDFESGLVFEDRTDERGSAAFSEKKLHPSAKSSPPNRKLRAFPEYPLASGRTSRTERSTPASSTSGVQSLQARQARPSLRNMRSSGSLYSMASQQNPVSQATAQTRAPLPRSESSTSARPFLRSKASLSNLSAAASSGTTSQSGAIPSGSGLGRSNSFASLAQSSLSRKKSMPSLSPVDASGDTTTPSHGMAAARPSFPARSPSAFSTSSIGSTSASYAQPTRASLAKHSLAADHATTSYGSSYSAHLREKLQAHPVSQFSHRPLTPTSPALMSPSLSSSRLTQPTVSSRAKFRGHIPTGSDPSGRSSASLGRPLPSSGSSSSLTSLSAQQQSSRILRHPRKAENFGDGTELDGFDDLPINKESEKKFLKIPKKRMSSGGETSSISRSSSALKVRERMESAPEKLQNLQRKYGEPAHAPSHLQQQRGQHSSIQRSRVESTSRLSGNTASKRVGQNVLGVAPAGGEKKPKLQLIRSLSAAGLAKVQGQGEMRWNPLLMKWEGNESSLRDFDNMLASSARPALISPIFGPLSPRITSVKSHLSTLPTPLSSTSKKLSSVTTTPSLNAKAAAIAASASKLPAGSATPQMGGVRVVGDMVFDPVRTSWYYTGTDKDGEEELDFGEDEAEDAGPAGHCKSASSASGLNGQPRDAWEGGESARLRTRRSFANESAASGDEGEDGVMHEEEFDFPAFAEETRGAQARHDEEMRPWEAVLGGGKAAAYGTRTRSGAQEIRSRLWDIRDVVKL